MRRLYLCKHKHVKDLRYIHLDIDVDKNQRLFSNAYLPESVCLYGRWFLHNGL